MSGPRLGVALMSVILGLSLFVRPGVSAGEEKKGDERRRQDAALIEKITPTIVILHAAKDKATEKGARTRLGLGAIVDPKGLVVVPRRLLAGFDAVEVVLSDGRRLTPKTVCADPLSNLAPSFDLPNPSGVCR
jgi:S1-C subfamily serine protease